MKRFFGKTNCEQCGGRYDSELPSCPNCGTKSREDAVQGYREMTILPFARQIALFLMGWLGFQVLALVVSQIDFVIAMGNHPSWGEAELIEFDKSIAHVGPVHFITYALLFAILSLIVWDGWKKNLRSFLQIRSVLIGMGIFVGLLAFSMIYSIILNAILAAAGGNYEPNGNENTIQDIVAGFPLVSFLVFGLVGPVCEELTYRVGLFSFFGRFGKVAAYLASALVFALIHFDFGSFGDPSALVVELYNLPSYLAAGILLSVAYHKGGFSASVIAHVLNNVLSVLLTLGAK